MELEHVEQRLTCVTKELVHQTAHTQPDLFIRDGVIQTYFVLYHLGFDIRWKRIDKNVAISENKVVRDQTRPYLTYRTTIYKGLLRRAVKSVNSTEPYNECSEVQAPDGIRYHRYKWHELEDLYRKYGVLQPTNLSDYIQEEDMINIADDYKEV